MQPTITSIPLLLSFALGLLVGLLTADLVALHPIQNRPSFLDRDSILWLLLFAAFTFGILITVVASLLT